MALSKIFKKNDAPDELPDLAIDELKKEMNKDFSEKEEPKAEEAPPKTEEKPAEKVEEQPPEEKTEQPTEEKVEGPAKPKEKVHFEKSFFNPLLAELKKDNFDPSKINSWYQKKFSEKGAIEEMKEYWEKQKNDFITGAIEKEFKERINQRMNNLQKLEGEWQEIYIELIKKEEEMKKEEKNIKKIIKDFSQMFVKKGNLKKERKTK